MLKMARTAVCAAVVIISLRLLGSVSSQYHYPAVPLDSSECPIEGEIDPLLEEVDSNASSLLLDWIRLHCGQPGTGWTQVGYLDMTDPEQTCPGVWREYIVSEQRVCGRVYIESDGICSSAFFSANGQSYTQVCGRIIGYVFGSPDGYSRHPHPAYSIQNSYIDGISMTYGNPRTHIWSFYGGTHENSCTQPNPYSFIEGHYFCEFDERLWDGEGCTNEHCAVNDPPWFLATLPESTTEDLEVRICCDNGPHDEDTPVQMLELYVK